MKKILLVNGSFLNSSGCGVIAKNTYNILNSKNFEIEVFTAQNRSGLISYKYENLFIDPYNTPKKYIKNLLNFYYNFKSRENISKLLRDFKPDIIHVHSLQTSALTYSILKPCIEQNIPIIMTLHDVFLICPMMTLMKKNKIVCKDVLCKGFNKIPCVINNCGNNVEQSTRMALISFVNKLTGYDKQIQKFIAPSKALADIMIKYNSDINSNNIVVINNFLSSEELKTIPNYTNQGYFLYIGRLSPEKGVHYLLEAMRDLPREIKLKIAGTGAEESKLKKYAKENNLDNVEFLGFKNREEIQELYQNCISTILPCNWFEIFGMTNIESFINGKPVIASNIGGIPEIVEDNINGLLFEPGNVEQLKECILKYWNNPDLVVEHGKNGYQKAITQYTEKKYYQELIKVYEEVLNESK